MKRQEEFGWAFVVAVIIYLLGLLWHPFGRSNVYWHIVLGIVMILLAVGVFEKEEVKTKKKIRG